MVTIRCTQKTARRFKLALSSQDSPPENRLGDWYANLFNFGSSRWVLCLSELSSLSVLIPARKTEFPAYFPTTLEVVLRGLGIPGELAEREASACSEFRFGRTQNRQTLGYLNDFAFHYSWGLADSKDPLQLMLEFTGMPCRGLPLIFPDKTVFKLFGLPGTRRRDLVALSGPNAN